MGSIEQVGKRAVSWDRAPYLPKADLPMAYVRMPPKLLLGCPSRAPVHSLAWHGMEWRRVVVTHVFQQSVTSGQELASENSSLGERWPKYANDLLFKFRSVKRCIFHNYWVVFWPNISLIIKPKVTSIEFHISQIPSYINLAFHESPSFVNPETFLIYGWCMMYKFPSCTYWSRPWKRVHGRKYPVQSYPFRANECRQSV